MEKSNNKSKKKTIDKSDNKEKDKTNKKSINNSKNKKDNKSDNKSGDKSGNKSKNQSKDSGKKSNNKSINLYSDKTGSKLSKKSGNLSEIKDLNNDEQNQINQSNNQIINESKKEEEESNIITINEEAKIYFNSIVPEEENPITLGMNTNIRYYNLENIFNTFYPIDSLPIAKEVSKEERRYKKIKDPSFTYGEITFRTMAYIFEYLRDWLGKDFFIRQLREGDGGIFYDLGSGTGKAVIAMSLFGPFKKLIGIELLQGLWDLSMRSKIFYEKTITDKFIKFNALFTMERTNIIDFYNGDFMREKWNDASIIFVNSTCFSQDLMEKIGIKAKKECQIDTVIITITKKLNNLNTDWEYKTEFKRLMSWGVGTIYIYIRRKMSINNI